MARSCAAAIVAIPLFGVSALTGQTTDESDIGATHLTEVVQSVNGDDAVEPLAAELYGTLIQQGGSEVPEDAVVWSEGRDSRMACIWCTNAETAGDVLWHRTGILAPLYGYKRGHGEHGWWVKGFCLLSHPFCSIFTVQGLTRTISDAVAAHDIAALAGYANMPSVVLFADRSAIQILGCDGETIAGHVPVNAELFVAIEVAAAQLDPAG